MVLATDEVYTYAIFNYGQLSWSAHTEAGGDTTGGEGGVPAFVRKIHTIIILLVRLSNTFLPSTSSPDNRSASMRATAPKRTSTVHTVRLQ